MRGYSGAIRPFHSDDLQGVQDVYYLAHVDEYQGESADFPPEGFQDNPDLQSLFDASDIFVFDENGIKGFVGNRQERIIWLYVHPDYRGQKIGQQLIDYMLKRLQGRAAISVIKSNQLALDLYQRRGFKVVGEFEFDYQGVPVKVLGLVLSILS